MDYNQIKSNQSKSKGYGTTTSNGTYGTTASNETRESDKKLEEVQIAINQVKDVMSNNIEKVVQRGEAIEELDKKAQDLNTNAGRFKKASKDLNRMMCMKNAKLTITVTLIIIIIITVLVLIIYYSNK